MTVFLCTTGTSAAKNLRDDSGKPLLNGRWVAEQGGVEAAAERILQSFAGFGKDDDTALQRRLSAEIHSLARMGVAADDRVILFSSETAEGEACARAVRLSIFRSSGPASNARWRWSPAFRSTTPETFGPVASWSSPGESCVGLPATAPSSAS